MILYSFHRSGNPLPFFETRLVNDKVAMNLTKALAAFEQELVQLDCRRAGVILCRCWRGDSPTPSNRISP